MKTPEEKEKIVKRFLSGESATKLSKEYNFDTVKAKIKHQEEGINGLKSQTGKTRYKNPNAGLHLRKPKNKIEELELELMKKEIEIARLKKGYMVKGVGAEKEFVTIFDKNTK